MRELTINEFEDVSGGIVWVPVLIVAAKWTAGAVGAAVVSTAVVGAAHGAYDAAVGNESDPG